MSVIRVTPIWTCVGSTRTSPPPPRARLSSAIRPVITAVWPATLAARTGAWASGTGSSTRATASRATAIATARSAGRSTTATARSGRVAPKATTPSHDRGGISTTAPAIAADHANASARPG